MALLIALALVILLPVGILFYYNSRQEREEEKAAEQLKEWQWRLAQFPLASRITGVRVVALPRGTEVLIDLVWGECEILPETPEYGQATQRNAYWENVAQLLRQNPQIVRSLLNDPQGEFSGGVVKTVEGITVLEFDQDHPPERGSSGAKIQWAIL